MRIKQGKWLLQQEIQVRFPLGCILLEIKEKESHKKFVSILSEEFGGMSERYAYKYMVFTKKCIELPKLRQFAESNWSKAVSLLESCSDESIKEIEEKGINGKALEEYDGMSINEFKSLIKKLKKRGDNPEAQGLKAENDMLKQAIEGYKLMVPNGPDASWASNMLTEIENTFMRLDGYLSSIAFDARIIGDDNLQAQVVGLHARMMDRFWRFEQRWEDYTGQKIEQ
ncbi:hypothetical protein [Candidatus Magnetominusculus dajiuhuensis]|uniref:hypothetical protein n=1 Tax=Candidatus Magnetominusculus dajiuhuensis TaxID=3137712 RepID=UPI003B4320B2